MNIRIIKKVGIKKIVIVIAMLGIVVVASIIAIAAGSGGGSAVHTKDLTVQIASLSVGTVVNLRTCCVQPFYMLPSSNWGLPLSVEVYYGNLKPKNVKVNAKLEYDYGSGGDRILLYNITGITDATGKVYFSFPLTSTVFKYIDSGHNGLGVYNFRYAIVAYTPFGNVYESGLNGDVGEFGTGFTVQTTV